MNLTEDIDKIVKEQTKLERTEELGILLEDSEEEDEDGEGRGNHKKRGKRERKSSGGGGNENKEENEMGEREGGMRKRRSQTEIGEDYTFGEAKEDTKI